MNIFKEFKQIPKKIINLVLKAWKGEERLWVVFWIYFVLVDFLFWVNEVYKIIPKLSDIKVSNFLELKILFSFVSILMSTKLIFQTVAIWRCAFNSNWRTWGYISRILILPYALWSLYQITSFVIYFITLEV